MGVKSSVLGRLDGRYGSRSELKQLRRRVRDLEKRTSRAEAALAEVKKELLAVRGIAGPALRLSKESTAAIEQLLAAEVEHQQQLDGITGAGR